ncbi:MAG: inositol monophosphatase family protein [Gammaproteobacteria bacterium]|nr:inositol monophosphatase family protein [Gammaproteobacteria bacterium]
MNIDQDALHGLMRSVGREQLVPRFARLAGSLKADGSLLTEADLAAQQALAKALLRLYPGSVVLGEEMSASEQAHGLGAGRPLWCLDPLDGTRNFSAGIPYFSISIALLEGGRVTLAAVYDPLRDELFHADRSSEALLNGAALQPRTEAYELQQSIALVDFKRLPPGLATRLVSAPPYQSQRSFGSVALDWCWLAGRPAGAGVSAWSGALMGLCRRAVYLSAQWRPLLHIRRRARFSPSAGGAFLCGGGHAGAV